METIDRVDVAQEFLLSIDVPDLSIFVHEDRRFGAATHWPNGDILRDKACHGIGQTLEAAITDMLAKVELAKVAVKTLKTAAECKAAVIDLIREHDAAPASFRDAVDALPVAS